MITTGSLDRESFIAAHGQQVSEAKQVLAYSSVWVPSLHDGDEPSFTTEFSQASLGWCHPQYMTLLPAVVRSRCWQGTNFAQASQFARKSVPGPRVSPTWAHLKNTRPLRNTFRSKQRQSLHFLSHPAGPNNRTIRFGCCSFENFRSASKSHACCAGSVLRCLVFFIRGGKRGQNFSADSISEEAKFSEALEMQGKAGARGGSRTHCS